MIEFIFRKKKLVLNETVLLYSPNRLGMNYEKRSEYNF